MSESLYYRRTQNIVHSSIHSDDTSLATIDSTIHTLCIYHNYNDIHTAMQAVYVAMIKQ